MQPRQLLQALFAFLRQLNLHATLVASTRVAAHQTGLLAPRNQRHDAVVLGLQTLGELRDGRPLAARETP